MFCNTVWNGLHILPDGYIRLCSIGANSKPELDLQRCRDQDGNVMHILTHSIQDIMNSDKHKEVRLLNLNNSNEWSPHCSCCENREIITNFDRAHKNKSRRIYLMNIENNNSVDENNFKNRINISGEIDWMPNSLDIRFGNLCNQKCVMCSPSFSNLWYDEYFEYYGVGYFGQGKRLNFVKDYKNNKWVEPNELSWFENPIWWEKFEQMAPHLRHIYITGGEPMVTPAHDEMLDRLINSGHAKHIWLEYDTNCSAINDKIAQRWFHFKKVDIRGSMDAIGDQYEVIRFGGKWDKFVKNVARLKEYEIQSNKKIKLLAVTTCFQIPTMYSIIESEKWCQSMGIEFHLRFLEGPQHLSVASLPNSAKEELISYYRSHSASSTKSPIIVKHLENHLGHRFHKPYHVKEFIKFMDFLDKSRKTNWRKVFPEVNTLITKHVTII